MGLTNTIIDQNDKVFWPVEFLILLIWLLGWLGPGIDISNNTNGDPEREVDKTVEIC